MLFTFLLFTASLILRQKFAFRKRKKFGLPAFGWIKEDGSLKQNREREEIEEKFKKLKTRLPWL
jgi:hypothetical protein